MNTILTLILVALICLTENPFVVNQELIEELKKTATWGVQEFSDNIFKGWTTKQLKETLMKEKPKKQVSSILSRSEIVINELKLQSNNTLPDSFDARAKWPKCIGPVLNQGYCGSCYAFSASETFGDTLCISNNKTTYTILSSQDFVSCDKTEFGCKGGNIVTSFWYLEGPGIVTYSCFPYASSKGVVPSCPTSCVSSKEKFIKHKCKKDSVFNLGEQIQSMKIYLTSNGPLSLYMRVYSDFYSYSNGIYKYTSGSFMGGHYVKLIGYGYDSTSNEQYWICQNSWGKSWGIKGLFYIKEKEVQIDDYAYNCIPLS